MNIAVVGGGWAGLSAAVTAVRLGYQVRLFESAAVLGGRARSVQAPGLNTPIDNGQHILLGAYTATLELMSSLGLDIDRQFLRTPLSVLSVDGSLRIQAWRSLPAPLHLVAGLLTAKGISWQDKKAAMRAMNQLRLNGWRVPRDATVQEWLSFTLQPAGLQRLLWIPLCIATMNTPPEQACAQLFAHVLRDSLGAYIPGAGDMLIPRTTLSELWPQQVETLALRNALSQVPGAELNIQCSTTIRKLQYVADRPSDTAQLMLDDSMQRYDAVILSGNTPSTARLLATLPSQAGTASFLNTLNEFQHAPIATLTLELDQSFKLAAPMLLLHEDRRRGHYGQWLFQGQDAEQRLLHIVVSDAEALLQQERPAALAGMLDQLRTQLRQQRLPAVRSHSLIAEKRATFLAVPGLKRPANDTPWPRVWVAGDWTDTGYPAVLEGAVRSGRHAALAMHATLSEQGLQSAALP